MRERSHRQRLAVLERDAALARTSRARRWAIAATAALTAGFAALVSAVAPGRSLGAKRATTSSARAPAPAPAPASNAMPPLASPSQLGLQGPDQAPQPDPSQSSSPPAQPSPDSSQSSPPPAQSSPPPTQAAPAPAQSDPGAGGGAVVSGGS